MALVTSLRDGMNLVSYEFVACQNVKKGVLILSEVKKQSQMTRFGYDDSKLLYSTWDKGHSKVFIFIISQLAGAAQSLGAGAILVNPVDTSEVAVAIKYALDMPESDREECHRHNFEHVTTHTAQVWADTFVR